MYFKKSQSRSPKQSGNPQSNQDRLSSSTMDCACSMFFSNEIAWKSVWASLRRQKPGTRLPQGLTELRLPRRQMPDALRFLVQQLPCLTHLDCCQTGYYPCVNFSQLQVSRQFPVEPSRKIPSKSRTPKKVAIVDCKCLRQLLQGKSS